jgi:hypothetical protein
MKVKIYQPSKTATQSGKKPSEWLLVPIEENKNRWIDNVTGWTSTSNTKTQLKLSFKDKESAISYAKKQGFDYKIIEPKTALICKKSYADNFLNK